MAGLSTIEVDGCLTRTWCGDDKAWAHVGTVATADVAECDSAVGVARHERWGPDEHMWACSGSSGRRFERRQAAVRHRHAMTDVHRAQRGALVAWADVGRPRRAVPRAGILRARCRDCCSPYVRPRRRGRLRRGCARDDAAVHEDSATAFWDVAAVGWAHLGRPRHRVRRARVLRRRCRDRTQPYVRARRRRRVRRGCRESEVGAFSPRSSSRPIRARTLLVRGRDRRG